MFGKKLDYSLTEYFSKRSLLLTGLVIPSANNVVPFYFKLKSKSYIFQQDYTPYKVNVYVYSMDYFVTVREPYT